MPSRDDRDVWPDNLKEIGVWLLFISVICSMGLLWYTDPFFIHQVSLGSSNAVEDPGWESPPTPSGEQLTIAAADAAYMNRIFSERSTEVGYCAFLRGDRLQPHLADTISATEDSLEFSTANCPGTSRPRATIHTHPSGSLGLSMADRTTFITKGYRYMCVQTGDISTGPGTPADALACYKYDRLAGEIHFHRVPVIVE